MENIDLNRPAFGSGAQKVSETITEPAGEVIKEEVPAESVEESKVPYSRFKKFHDEAKEARQEAEYWRQQAESRTTQDDDRGQDPLSEARKLWIENYGDTESSHKAWENQLKINEALRNEAIGQAREEAREALRNERYQEVQRTQENIQTIDSELEALQDYVGRNLTEREEEAILDIVDEFTPKDNQGNYSGALLPMDRAWEIYELKQGSNRSNGRNLRDNVASLSGSQSQGDSSVQAEKDKEFNPRDWDAYKRRLGN